MEPRLLTLASLACRLQNSAAVNVWPKCGCLCSPINETTSHGCDGRHHCVSRSEALTTNYRNALLSPSVAHSGHAKDETHLKFQLSGIAKTPSAETHIFRTCPSCHTCAIQAQIVGPINENVSARSHADRFSHLNS